MTDSSQTKVPEESMPRLVSVIQWTRLISVVAVLSSLVGAIVMFWVGSQATLGAILILAGILDPVVDGSSVDPSDLATIQLLESLDDFLVGLVFLYFAYGIYALFIQMGNKSTNTPRWLKVEDISTLKHTLLEVLVVLLAVVFVKGLLERLSFRSLEWTYLVIPLSTLAIAASTRLLQEAPEAKSKEADE
jgi:uncharacterized membrane protein YqhA